MNIKKVLFKKAELIKSISSPVSLKSIGQIFHPYINEITDERTERP